MENEVIALILIGFSLGMITAMIIDFLVGWYGRYELRGSSIPTWKELYIMKVKNDD